jgi:nicotinate-nucleotide--dimethylbenzimidazole phosphoribosyltransferase
MLTSTAHRALIPPTANAPLEKALLDKLARRNFVVGALGELEPLAVRLGLVQNTLKPRFEAPRLIVFAADHGLAVDDVGGGGRNGSAGRSTAEMLRALLAEQLPLAVFARIQGLELTAVDSGIAEPVPPHVRLLSRKIAHGTRNCRVGAAMSIDQAHAAMRAGMEIGDSLSGNVIACAGLGVGSAESAALVLACISGHEVSDFLSAGAAMEPALLDHLRLVLDGARSRHKELSDPIEILAAVGGFEVAMMAGLMLAAASRRRLIISDGWAACAALAVAAVVAPSVADYCVHARSTRHQGLDCADGTGATLVWPLLRSAAALLSEVQDNGL